ncbi:MAG: cytochrome P450, partial [Gammaproteobacteria bacterium]|nr:cytochrome P450 [Gammaproteobacteria bacterium]
RTYFVNDPDEIRRILVRRHVKYRKGPGFERVEMLLGNGIIVSDGDVWRRARTMVQPAFSRQNVHRLLDTMIVCCERRAERWQAVAASGGVLNITREMSEFALELILRAIFGPDYDNRILQGGENPFAFLSQDATRDLSVVMKMHKLRKFLLQVVEARKASPEVEQYDFLSMYIDATDKDGRHFSDRELIDELITLIVAGYETSAGTLNWAWYLLATHPGAEATLLAEARRLMPDRDAITIDSVTDMHYAQAMLEETLRLYPPVWLYSRRSLEADELTEYDIPPDTDIFLSPYILHRTAEFWEDPDRFEPARFGQDSAYAKGERPYFPFSLGPRRCLGEYFSFLEMKIHLGYLLQRFRLEPVDDRFPGLDLGINLRSLDNIHLKPSGRLSPA